MPSAVPKIAHRLIAVFVKIEYNRITQKVKGSYDDYTESYDIMCL